MSLDYTALVLGRSTPAQIVARLYPDETDRPEFDTSGRLWVGDDRPRRGYTLFVAPRDGGHFDASLGSDGPWVARELPAHVSVEFALDKDRLDIVAAATLEKLARLLETGGEDVAFVQNGSLMLLRRCGGELKRYRASFWETLEPDEIPPMFRIPDATPSEQGH